MKQFDNKNRKFYDELTEEEKRKFSSYLMIRWGSSVQGSADLQHFYLVSTNERLNKKFFSIPGSAERDHKKLQWLVATTVSPGMGTMRHNWISNKKDSNPLEKQIAELFPHLRDDEVKLMAKLNTKKDIDAYLKELGRDSKKK